MSEPHTRETVREPAQKKAPETVPKEAQKSGSGRVQTDSTTLAERLEALLMIAEQPLSEVMLAAATTTPVQQVRESLTGLQADYDGKSGGPRRGFELRQIAGGYRFYARACHDELLQQHLNLNTPPRLSQAALETLAVVAYKQPLTRGQIAQVRAVNVDSVVRTLAQRGLIEEVGHDGVTGAALYGTTNNFLERVGIDSVAELPPLSPLLDDGSEGFTGERF